MDNFPCLVIRGFVTTLTLTLTLKNWQPYAAATAAAYAKELLGVIHQQKCETFSGSRDQPGASGAAKQKCSKSWTGANAGLTLYFLMITALPGISPNSSTYLGLLHRHDYRRSPCSRGMWY